MPLRRERRRLGRRHPQADRHPQLGEAVERTGLVSGRVLITDRGYARVRDFAHVLAAGSDFITRLGWRSVALQTPAGTAFDLIVALPEGGQAVEHRVRGVQPLLRPVLQRLPERAAASNHKRVARRSTRSGHKIDARTTQAAGYMMLLNPPDTFVQPTAKVLELYRARWQVELGFKRLKILGGIDKLPCATAGKPQPARPSQRTGAHRCRESWDCAHDHVVRAIMPTPCRGPIQAWSDALHTICTGPRDNDRNSKSSCNNMPKSTPVGLCPGLPCSQAIAMCAKPLHRNGRLRMLRAVQYRSLPAWGTGRPRSRPWTA
jgi:hypothetical protein